MYLWFEKLARSNNISRRGGDIRRVREEERGDCLWRRVSVKRDFVWNCLAATAEGDGRKESGGVVWEATAFLLSSALSHLFRSFLFTFTFTSPSSSLSPVPFILFHIFGKYVHTPFLSTILVCTKTHPTHLSSSLLAPFLLLDDSPVALRTHLASALFTLPFSHPYLLLLHSYWPLDSAYLRSTIFYHSPYSYHSLYILSPSHHYCTILFHIMPFLQLLLMESRTSHSSVKSLSNSSIIPIRWW